MDQFAWVRLAQQRAAPTASGQDWRRLNELRHEGTATFVLSAANYLETWHRRQPSSRHAVATAMKDLTDYNCILPVQKIADLEIEYFLLRNLRSPGCQCPAVEPAAVAFGRGVAHAFDSPTGRLRLVQRVHTGEAGEGPPAGEEDVERVRQLIARIPADDYEWWSLAASADDTANLPMEFRGEHRFGYEHVARQEAKLAWFDAHPSEFHRVGHYVAADITLGLLETINTIAERHSIPDSDIRRSVSNAEYLVGELPSADCQTQLTVAKMRNRQWKWHQHDYTDIAALSGVLPYVDILVTEKSWTHVIRMAKLDKKYGTHVVSSLAELTRTVGEV